MKMYDNLTRAKKGCYEIIPDNSDSALWDADYSKVVNGLVSNWFDVVSIPDTSAFYAVKEIITRKIGVPKSDALGARYLFAFCNEDELQRMKAFSKEYGFVIIDNPIDENLKRYLIEYLND